MRNPDKKPPTIISSKWLTHSRLFHVQELVLRFSNGAERIYERLNPGFERSVMVIPLLDRHTVLLLREYGAGMDDYYLSLPKGAMDEGESVLETANRELMEEAGYGADHLEFLKKLYLSPSYMGNAMHIVVASGLYEKRLPGDEPEALEVIPYPIADIPRLIEEQNFCEAYGVAALMMLSTMDLDHFFDKP